MSSIRRRISWALVPGVLLLWCVTGVLVYAAMRQVLQRQFDAALTAKARALGTLLLHAEEGVEFEFADELMLEFSRRRDPEYFEIRLPDGAVLERSRSLAGGDLPAVGDEPEVYMDIELPDGRAGRLVALRMIPQILDAKDAKKWRGSKVSPVMLEYAREREGLNRTLWALATSLAAATIPLGLISMWLVVSLVKKGLKPLSRLAEQAGAIDVSRRGARFEGQAVHEELMPIYLRLNDLLSRVDAAFENERRFTADVAHELRTPIAETQALAEVALKWEKDSPARERALQEIHEVSKRMEAMVGTLLALARCHWGRQALTIETFDLAELIREVARRFEPAAKAKGLRVDVELPEQAGVKSDGTIVQAMINNLWSNAVAYCPAGGEVRCVLERKQGWALRLENTDGSLAQEDLEHLFQAFWRKEAARSGGEHGGLGLTLVKEYARLIGARVTPELRGGRLAMNVSFAETGDGRAGEPVFKQ